MAPRDYKSEYRRRIQRGLSLGRSRSEARGHPHAPTSTKSPAKEVPQNETLERALRRLRSGQTLGETAKQLRISRERLSRYAKAHAGASWSGGAWTFNDLGRRRVPFIEGGEVGTLWVRGYEAARLAGAYWDQAHLVLGMPDAAPAFVRRWENVAIRDAAGRLHTFTTDLNEIYRATHVNDAPFEQIYKLIR